MQSRCIILHFEGFQKRDCFEEACQDGSEIEMPIRAILRNSLILCRFIGHLQKMK